LLLCVLAPAGCGSPSTTTPTPVTRGGTADDRAATVAALQSAWQAWRASGPASYRYTYQRSCFCLPRGPVVVTVRNRQLDSAVDAQTGAPVPPDELQLLTTVDGLFTQLFQAVDEQAWAIRASYDPRLGYPREGYVDRSAQIADEELGFSVSGFEPL
jgi:hypothetical protein